MRRITFQIVLILLFVSLSNYSQDHILTGGEFGYYKSITYWPAKSDPNATIVIDYNGGQQLTPHVGFQFIQEPNYIPPFERDNIERTAVGFNLTPSNLNLEENEIIYMAKIVVSTNNSQGSGSFNIKFIGSNIPGSNAEEFWHACSTGTFLGSLSYSSGGGINITNIVNNNLGNAIWAGFYEGGNGIAHLFTIELQIWTSFVPQVNITAQSNFTGGDIKVGIDIDPVNETSPFNFLTNVGSTVNLEAVEQSNGGYSRIWNDTEAPIDKSKWVKRVGGGSFDKSPNKSYSFTAAIDDHGSAYEAGLRKVCNVSFKNNFIGIPNGGSMRVNGTTYSAPTSNFSVVEQNKIRALSTQYYEFNGIKYTFRNWVYSGTKTGNDFYPDEHDQIIANYRGQPKFTYIRNLRFNTFNPRFDRYVILAWDEHPNSNVTQYQIWRHEKHNGRLSDPELRTTVNRGTTTWTDVAFYIANSGTDYQLFYDVRAFYSIESTYSPESFLECFGTDSGALDKTGSNEYEIDNSPDYYALSSNYPNPFNPSTQIKYQLKDAGNVSLKIYDALGKEVANLVNSFQNEGYYQVNFNGSHLSSGIYFYTMKVNNYSNTKKMLLTK